MNAPVRSARSAVAHSTSPHSATPRAREAPARPRTPSARPVAPRGPKAAARRKRHHLGFVVFASVVIGLMVVGLVTLNAFLAQSSFRVQDLEGRLDGLSERYETLTREAAHLSAPGRIAAWARQHGMRLPDDIHILHVRSGSQTAPAGESGPLDLDRLGLKPIVEGSR